MIKDHVIVITCGSSGLGAELVFGAVNKGAHVAFTYSSNTDRADRVVHRCADLGSDVLAIKADVVNEDDCKRVAREVSARWKGIDILINNAGTTRKAKHADLDALNAEDFIAVYSVNVIGTYQMIRACVAHLRASKTGSVINISSAGADLGVGTSVAYSASKAALNSMTRSLARALAPELRINTVAPGFMATPWFSDEMDPGAFSSLIEDQRRLSVLDRVGDPVSMVDPILFLASGAAAHITGVTLPVEGGALLGMAPHGLR